MDSHKKNSNNYGRVMSRVFNRSRTSLRSGSSVTRHDVPSSVRVGAKPSVLVSAASSGVFSELPTVLNDFVANDERDKVMTKRPVRRRRTLKSLDPGKAKSPPRTSRDRGIEYSRIVRARGSSPAVLVSNGEEWSEAHVRQCHSSRSHTRLQELKDEIKAFGETDKLLRLRSHLYKSCGVVLDDVGNVLRDQAVQADPVPDKEITPSRRTEWLRLIHREDLIDLGSVRARVCEAHFSPDCIKINSRRKMLKRNSIPKLLLPLPNNFANKGIQAITETADASVQCNYVQTNAQVQTPLHLSHDNPRRRKILSEVQRCQKRLKITSNTQSEANTFFRLCDKFLTPTLARIAKRQTKIKIKQQTEML